MPEWRNLLLPQRDAGGGGNVAEALQRRASAQRAGIPAAGAVELDNCSLEAQKVTQQLLDARALPSRSRDLPLSRQNVADLGAAHAAPSFRPLGRRSGRIPALPYPPPR